MSIVSSSCASSSTGGGRHQVAGQAVIERLIVWDQQWDDQVETSHQSEQQLNVLDDGLVLVSSDSLGLAAAGREEQTFGWRIMPVVAIQSVCSSIALCCTLAVAPGILSYSSVQQMSLSTSTRAGVSGESERAGIIPKSDNGGKGRGGGARILDNGIS